MRMIRTFSLAIGLLFAAGPVASQTQDAARRPLPLREAPEVFQRVLTSAPGARLAASPGSAARGVALPVFSILYVYGQQGEWLEVGKDLRRGPEGWLKAAEAQDWSMMMAMQYAQQGRRRRVLFFERQQDVADLVDAPDPGPLVERLEQAADANRRIDPSVVSIEPPLPRGQQQFRSSPYLIPILGHRRTRFAGGQAATLLQVALVNAGQVATPSPPGLDRLGGAIVFVLDTTISMQPFLDRTREAIERVLGGLRGAGLDGKVTVGVVAFRNNMDQEPQRSRLGYTVSVVQKLDPAAPLEQVSAALRGLEEAKVSTHSFNEDAVAGLWTAVQRLDWAPFADQPKLLVFVSDAGALSGRDPRAMFRGTSLLNVVEAANRQGISILPLHIASAEGRRLGNVGPARQQYQQLGLTGDANSMKYRQLRAGTPAEFDRYMTEFERSLQPVFQAWSRNRPIPAPEAGSNGEGAEGYGALVVNELFSAQQRYIGARAATRSRPVATAWAADRDLTDPDLNALRVSVYLTRNQLSQLALSTRRIAETAANQEMTAANMFRMLQALSASTAQDPERFKDNTESVGDSGVLPGFLKLLPYRSRFLGLTAQGWSQMTRDEQQQLLDELEFKLRAYREMDADQRNWVDLAGGDPGQQVYPMPLEYLP
ncbi:vWA domain-containing protein [Belnapia rosea]|uniref:Serine/threonine-protein kinase PpkA n=1 Tax=Belnapia rosea TaxID=938405 RepID=A0A1G6S496_9PROT|nr:vWA domain-containing protein [Belnapia rosea]SDD11521.1 serine/threonine-protein kinase PpkA [Belnapia rosea]